MLSKKAIKFEKLYWRVKLEASLKFGSWTSKFQETLCDS